MNPTLHAMLHSSIAAIESQLLIIRQVLAAEAAGQRHVAAPRKKKPPEGESPQDRAAVFWSAWADGKLPVPYVSTRSVDVHEAYLKWAATKGISSHLDLASFVTFAQERIGAAKKQLRFRAASDGKTQQAMFIIPPGAPPAAGLDQRTAAVHSFSERLGAWVPRKAKVRARP